MKRRAILLGHIDGELSTNVDLRKVHEFLGSCRGGAWNDQEIIPCPNISLNELNVLIRDTQENRFDFVFLYFSGHGGYVRDTVLELNPQGETVSERALSGLAERQLNIFDCCRVCPNQRQTKLANLSNRVSLMESGDLWRLYVRTLYETRIMQALPQEMSLYACQIGESAFDFGKGGIYTNYLLEACKSLPGTYVLASQAHAEAAPPTSAEALIHNRNQHPDYFMAKLPARLQLILAINCNGVAVPQRS